MCENNQRPDAVQFPSNLQFIESIPRHSQESGKIGLHYHVAAIFTRGGPIEDWKVIAESKKSTFFKLVL